MFVELNKNSIFALDFPQRVNKWSRRRSPPRDLTCLKILRQMYVIVEINGQQFKAEQGKKLFVHHIQNAESGAVVEFDKVLLVDNNGEVTVGVPTVEGAKVVCEVLSPLVKVTRCWYSTRREEKVTVIERSPSAVH